MAIVYPNALDNLTNPAAGSAITAPPHGQQHADANDAIEALQSKLGVGAGSATATNKLLVGTGNGTSTWGGTVSAIVVNNSTIGTPSMTGGTIISSVYNNGVFGTVAITGGTVNSATLGTPTIQNPTLSLGTVTGPTNLDIAFNADSANSKVVLTTIRRQGGTSTSWSTAGTTNFTETQVHMQAGVLAVGTTATEYTITFPVPFSKIPIVHVTQTSTTTASTGMTRNIGTASFGYVTATTDLNNTVHWLAVGKR